MQYLLQNTQPDAALNALAGTTTKAKADIRMSYLGCSLSTSSAESCSTVQLQACIDQLPDNAYKMLHTWYMACTCIGTCIVLMTAATYLASPSEILDMSAVLVKVIVSPRDCDEQAAAASVT